MATLEERLNAARANQQKQKAAADSANAELAHWQEIFNSGSQAVGQAGTFGAGDEAAATLRWMGQGLNEIIPGYAMMHGASEKAKQLWPGGDPGNDFGKAFQSFRSVEDETGSTSKSWGELHRDQLNWRNRAERDNPTLYTTTEIGTGFLQGGLGGLRAAGGRQFGSAMKEAAQTMKDAGWLERLGRTALFGGVEGGVTGALTADPEDRLKGTLYGGGLGLTLGALPFLADIGSAAWRQGKRLFQSPDDRADEIVAERLAEQFGTAEDVAGALEEVSPQATLADLDPMAAVAAAQTSPMARRAIMEMAEPRQAGQTERVMGILREEIADPAAYRDQMKQLKDSLSNMDQMTYGQIRNHPVPADLVDDIIKRPGFKRAVTEAVGAVSRRAGVSRIDIDDREIYTLGFLDEVKQQLDGLAQTTGDSSYIAAARELRERLDEIIPDDYMAARRAHAETAGILEAGEIGEQLGRTTAAAPAQTRREAYQAALTEEAVGRGGLIEGTEDVAEALSQRQAMAETGLASGLGIAAVPSGPTGSAAQQLARPVLEEAMMMTEGGARAIQRLGGERQMWELYKLINPTTGSRTAILEAAEEGIEQAAPDILRELSVGNITPALNQMVKSMVSDRKVTPEVANRMAEILVTRPTVAEASELLAKAGVREEAREQAMRFLAAIIPITSGATTAGAGALAD